jgi:capsular polysaccharide transport system permease protein
VSSANHTSLLSAWRIQARVIWALLMREIITRYGRRDIGFLWMFVGPMLLTVVIVMIHAFWGVRSDRGMSFVGFGITGFSAAFLWRSMANRCLLAVEPNLALMYHRNVKIIDIYVARILLEAAGETLAFTVLSLCGVFMGWMQVPVDILKVLGGWALLAWFGAAMALTLGALSEFHEMVAKIWRPLNFPTLILSGPFFMVDWLPEGLKRLVLSFPMIHGTELLREGFFGTAIHAHYDVWYLTAWCLGLTLLGLLLVRASQRRVVLQ